MPISFKAKVSRSWETKSAKVGKKGDLIGAPNFYL